MNLPKARKGKRVLGVLLNECRDQDGGIKTSLHYMPPK